MCDVIDGQTLQTGSWEFEKDLFSKFSCALDMEEWKFYRISL